jgi:hypothetical protein
MSAAAPQCKFIDIGGDQYYLGNPRDTYKLGPKDRIAFNAAFSDSRAEHLLCKYFEAGKDRHIHVEPADRRPLIEILERRRTLLASSQKIHSIVLADAPTRKYLANLEKILADLKSLPGAGAGTVVTAAATAPSPDVEYLKGWTNSDRFLALVQIAWYMLHPEAAESQGIIGSSWIDAMKSLKRTDLLGMIDAIKAENSARNGSAIEPLNYFSRLTMSEVASAKTLTNALELAKTQAITNAREKERRQLESRLKNILTVLNIHGYIDQNNMDQFTNAAAAAAAATTNSIIGDISNALVSKLGYSLEPIMAHLRQVYKPIFEFLEKVVRDYTGKIPVEGLLQLVSIANEINQRAGLKRQGAAITSGENAYGIRRLDGVSAEVVNFLKHLNDQIDRRFEEMLAKQPQTKEDIEEKRLRFMQQLLSLPPIASNKVAEYAKDKMQLNVTTGIYHPSEIILPVKAVFADPRLGLLAKYKKHFTDSKQGIPLEALGNLSVTDAYNEMQQFFGSSGPTPLFMISGLYSGFPAKVPYKLYKMQIENNKLTSTEAEKTQLTGFNPKFKLYDVVTLVDKYVNSSLLSMLALIVFYASLPAASAPLDMSEAKLVEEKKKKA